MLDIFLNVRNGCLFSVLYSYYITYFQEKYYLRQLESRDDAQLIVLPVEINHTHRLSHQRVSAIGAHLERIKTLYLFWLVDGNRVLKVKL